MWPLIWVSIPRRYPFTILLLRWHGSCSSSHLLLCPSKVCITASPSSSFTFLSYIWHQHMTLHSYEGKLNRKTFFWNNLSIHCLYRLSVSRSQLTSGERLGTPWVGHQSITERIHSCFWAILELPVNIISTFFKLEWPEGTYAGTGRTCNSPKMPAGPKKVKTWIPLTLRWKHQRLNRVRKIFLEMPELFYILWCCHIYLKAWLCRFGWFQV